MTPATPLLQFPWPLVFGAAVGLVFAVGIGFWSLRSRGAPGIVALVATALTGASAGAFLTLLWLWMVPMSRPAACLYSCAEMQFLSNEQFRQMMIMIDLAWILPVAALFFAAIAAWARKLG